MAGLINTNINKDDPLSSVAGYEAERVATGPEDMVENRVQGIISKNSPLMQQAQTSALKSMNARGLLNSSMAVGAAHDATIRQALPIAQQDAQTSMNTKLANQQAGNTASQVTATNQTQGALQAHQGLIQQGLQEKQGEQQMEQIAAQGEISKALQELQGMQSLDQIAAKGDLDQRLQALIGEQRLGEIAASGDIQQLIQELQGRQALEQIGAQGEQQRTTQQMINEHQTALAGLQHQFQLGQIDAQTLAQLRVNQQQIDAQVSRDVQLHQQALEQARAAGDLQAERDAQLQIYNLESMAEQSRNQIKLAEVNFTYQSQIEQLGQDNRIALQELVNQHQQTLQNSSVATNLYMTTMQAISNIGANPDLSAAQRQAGINQQVDMLRAGLEFTGSTAGQTFTIYNPSGGNNSTNAPPAGSTGGNTGGTSTTTNTGLAANPGALPSGSNRLYGSARDAEWYASQVAPLGAGRYLGEVREVGSGSGKFSVAWTPEGWVFV